MTSSSDYAKVEQKHPHMPSIYPQDSHDIPVKSIPKEEAQEEQCNTEDSASFFALLSMTYLNPLFKVGYARTLEHEDLGSTALQDQSYPTYCEFEKYFRAELQRPEKKRDLWNVLLKTFGYLKFIEAISFYSLYTAINFGPILILNALVKNLEGTETLDTVTLWVLVALIFVLPIIGSVMAARSNVIFAHAGVVIRNVLINKIYRKSLALSPAARQSSSSGQIVNMFSNDTAQLQRFMLFANNCMLALPTIVVCTILIYLQVGPATFVGLALIILVVPLNVVIFGLLNYVRRLKTVVTDQRVKLLNELLNGIRVVKFYAWEEAFAEKVTGIRAQELLYLKYLAYIFAFGFTVLLMAVPIFLPVLIFYTYAQLGNDLTAAKAFTAIALFNMMQWPFVFLPLGLSQYSQSLVSCQRMMTFFCLDEMDPYVNRTPADDDVVIKMEGVDLGWVTAASLKSESSESKSSVKKSEEIAVIVDAASSDIESAVAAVEEPINRSVYTLKGLNFSIKKGELVAVVGSVGSGKSSLLSGLLGEMILNAGKVHLVGSVAYCDQRAWILNESVQNNVLFGRPYDEGKFDAALYAADLEDDIKVLPGGVQTQIGEKGINLSGGQKARVALARALYSDADVFLLDDPLSAVDAHVGQFLFHECIRTCMAGKTRVLVTHNVHLLQYCDKVIVLQDGGIKAMGTFEEIEKAGVDVTAIEAPAPAADSTVEGSATTRVSSREMSSDWRAQIALKKSVSSQSASNRKLDSRSSTITTVEEKNEGDVKLELYSYYIRAGGILLFLGLVIFMMATQLFQVLSLYWLSYWGQESNQAEQNGDSLSANQNLSYLNIFAVLSVLSLVCYLLRSIFLANHRLGTSTKLHLGLLQGILNSPISFFDGTPIGRILNRFSSDMVVIDEELSQTLSQVTNTFSNVLGALGAIIGATKGTFLILFVPLVFMYNEIQKYFRNTNTAVARLESVSRSPIYSDFSQVLSGVNTIRAYNDQGRFITNLESSVDKNSVANITQQLCSNWLAIRLDFLGAMVSFFVAVMAIATNGFIPAGFLALGLTYSFQLTQYMKFVVRIVATMESQMNAVERIRHYMTNIEKEVLPTDPSEQAVVPEEWPSSGTIAVNSIQMSYGSGPLVLKDVSFNIEPREKVGLVGRTGCGKSSVIVAIYRFQKLREGSISIDGLDIATIPVKVLRSRLGIIPQDPIMFSASLRFNLDPFNKSSDDELWSVLTSAQMKDHVNSLPGKLDEIVAEGGDNFSAGQRQLICIARAILRRPKILFLDEATASIDNETDAIVQQMIRQQFADCTVLTIAHRLNTVIDSDRVLVLESGSVAEFDSPQALLKRPEGLFASLWERHQKSTNGETTEQEEQVNLT